MARSLGCIRRAGVEGTGTYGAGLTRVLREQGIEVLEVNRPNRSKRRLKGKSDPTDAENAARAVLAGEATAIPKSQSGGAEAMRTVSVARRSAVKAKTQAINRLRAILVSAPQEIRERLWKTLAALCGVNPLPASSGKTTRHRLNRGGDRQGNNALWTIAMVRMRSEPRTRAYVERRTNEGMSNKEIHRCLKRYLIRELYRVILSDLQVTGSTT